MYAIRSYYAEVTVMLELHAPTRRELLLGTGVLFAWAYLPSYNFV